MERFSHPLTVIPQELPGSKEHALKKANPGPLSKKLSRLAATQVMITQLLRLLCVNNHLVLVSQLVLTFTSIRVASTLVLTVVQT